MFAFFKLFLVLSFWMFITVVLLREKKLSYWSCLASRVNSVSKFLSFSLQLTIEGFTLIINKNRVMHVWCKQTHDKMELVLLREKWISLFGLFFSVPCFHAFYSIRSSFVAQNMGPLSLRLTSRGCGKVSAQPHTIL